MKQVVMKWEDDFVAKIDAAAEAAKLSRTAWLAEAAELKLSGPPSSTRARKAPSSTMRNREYPKKPNDCNHNYRQKSGWCPTCGDQN